MAIVVGDVDAASDVVEEARLQASRHWPRIAAAPAAAPRRWQRLPDSEIASGSEPEEEGTA